MRRLGTRSRFVRALLSLGVVVGVGATGTYALWTDSVPVSGTTISTGTIDLKVGGADSVSTFTSMNITTMVPGNSVAGVLTVSNTGSSPLRYYVTAQAPNSDGKSVGSNLQVQVTGASAVTGSSPSATCGGAALANVASTFSTTFANFLGSSAAPRLLSAGGSETLCIQATLPAGTGNSVQGGTANISFLFNGTSF